MPEQFFPNPRALYRIDEVIRKTGRGRSSIYDGIKRGTFPAPVKIGARAIAFDSLAIDAWIEARIAEARS